MTVVCSSMIKIKSINVFSLFADTTCIYAAFLTEAKAVLRSPIRLRSRGYRVRLFNSNSILKTKTANANSKEPRSGSSSHRGTEKPLRFPLSNIQTDP